MNGCYREIIDSIFLTKYENATHIEYKRTHIDFKDPLPCAQKRILPEDYDFYLYKIEMHYYAMELPGPWLTISCIDTKAGFRVYDIRYAGNKSCCY